MTHRRGWAGWRLLAAGVALAMALALAVAPATARASEPARRIVSLNLCSDDYLVLLAPGRVAALSPLARDSALSVVSGAARQLPWVRADAEAVLMLHPDLVLAGRYGAQTTLAALERRGLRVERLDLPQDFAGIRAQTRTMAVLLGVPERGEAMLAEMDAVLAGVKVLPPGRRALPLQARGYIASAGSLEDSVLRRAGLVNAGRGGRMGLEAILADRPDLLVVAQAPSMPSLATDLLAHPALAGIPRRVIPPALLACGGPWTAAAVALLAQ